MSAQHTQGRLVVEDETETDGRAYIVLEEKCGALAAVFNYKLMGNTFNDACRLAACWNACDGIPLDALEAMPSGPVALLPMYARLETQRDELLKFLSSIAAITTCADQDPEAMCAEIQGICRVALAALKLGEQA